jgi:hypothetical protein
MLPNGVFKTAWRIRDVRRAFWIERDMPQMSGAPQMPSQDAAIHHRRAPDASA